MNRNFSIADEVQGSPDMSRLPFDDIKEDILGEKYILTLILIGRDKARELNRKYRGKDRAANVLAFPLERDEGEIYICPEEADKEHEEFGYSRSGFLAYLFIHACLHLKGYEHGSTMKKKEREISRKFNI